MYNCIPLKNWLLISYKACSNYYKYNIFLLSYIARSYTYVYIVEILKKICAEQKRDVT